MHRLHNIVMTLMVCTMTGCSGDPSKSSASRDESGAASHPNAVNPMDLSASSPPTTFFTYGPTGYLASSANAYCAIASWPQWFAMGGPANGAPAYSAIPSGMVSTGECPLPSGFFTYGPTGYLAGSGGKYCSIASWPQWFAMGGPTKGAPAYPVIPNSMVSTGACSLPSGFFTYGPTGYMASNGGTYCSIASWPQWFAMGGPATGAPAYPVIPTSMTATGQCPLPSGFFTYGPTGYLASSGGTYCSIATWRQWFAMGGPATGAPAYPVIPSSMSSSGECPVPAQANLAGSWTIGGFLCTVAQSGGSLTFTNELGNISTGTFTSLSTVSGWGMQGTLSADGNTISWANGSTWTRWQGNPPAPTGLTLTAPSSSEIDLSWSSGGGDTASMYVVYQPGPVAPGCNATGRPAGLATSFSLSSLAPSSQYTIGVCATDAGGNVSPEIERSITTPAAPAPVPAPVDLVLTSPTPNEIAVSWVSGGASTAAFYVVYQPGAIAPGCNATGRPAGSSTSFLLTGLSASSPYAVGVCATDAGGDVSPELAGTTVTPAPASPPADHYGSIACSYSTGACGYSWDFANLTDAENAAIGGCTGSDCQIVLWVDNECAAASTGYDPNVNGGDAPNGEYFSGGYYAFGFATDTTNSEQMAYDALNECRDFGYQNCVDIIQFCSNGSGAGTPVTSDLAKSAAVPTAK